MVKNEQHDDYAMSVEAIELETELFRKELFEPQPVCPEPSGEDDLFNIFQSSDLGLSDGSEPWCSPVHSSGSSTRSSSTIDDKIDMFDHLTNGLQLGDEFNELTQLFSSQPVPVTGPTEVQQKHLLQHQQQEPISQQQYQSQNVSSTNNLSNHFNYSQFQLANSSLPANQTLTTKHFTHSTSPSSSRISSSSSPNCSSGCSPTALYSSSGSSSVFTGSSSGVSGSCSSNSSPVFIKTEDVQSPSDNSHSPPLSGVWQQLLSDGNNLSLATAHERSGNNGSVLTYPKFKIVKTESINGSSRPILNVTTTTRNNDKSLVINTNNTISNSNCHRVLNNGATTLVTTTVLNNNNFSNSVSPRSIKSSPPCSPTPLYSSYAFSPSSPSDMDEGASPTSPPLTTTITIPGGGPRYKVLSISTTTKGSPLSCNNSDLTSRRSTLAGGITKTKKIQPKVSAVRTMLSQSANGVSGGRGVLELVTNSSAKLAGSAVHLSPAPTVNTLVPVTPKIEVPTLPGCPPLLPSTAAHNSVGSSITFSHQVKVQKRHERMIKNRESASLSRKKKKEYVTNLENEIKSVRDENSSLKQEVSRLTSLVSELQRECSSLRQRLSSTGSFLSQSSSSMLLPSATVTKATAPALMLTVFCLLAINLPGMLPQWPSAPSSSNVLLRGVPPSSPDLLQLPAPAGLTQRRLLWSDYEEDLPPPTLNDTFFNSTMCPSMLNETESLRLESELRDWFDNKLHARWPRGRPAVASLLPGHHDDATTSLTPRLGLSVESKGKGSGQRRRRGSGSSSRKGEADDTKGLRLIGSKSSGTDDAARNALSALQQRLPSVYRRYFYNDPSPLTIHPSLQSASETGLVDSLEGPPPPPSLLEVIQSRPDTYYVVSLSRDLLLVPAELHNSTNTRPRMTLLLPAPLHHGGNSSGRGGSSGGQVAMLQIDCEVLHTSLVDVADLVVPPHKEQPHQKQQYSGTSDAEERLDDSPLFGTLKSRKYHQERDPSTDEKISGEDAEFYSEHAKNTAATSFKPKYEQQLERLSKYGNVGSTGKFFRKHSSGYQRRNVKPSNTSTSLDAASRADEANQTNDKNGLYDKDDEIPYSDEQFGQLYEQGHLDSVVDHPHRLHPKHLKKTDPKTRQSGNATSVTNRAEENQKTAVTATTKNGAKETPTSVKKEQRTKDWLYGKN